MPKLKLQPREFRVIVGGIAALALIAGYQLSRGPMQAYRDTIGEVREAEERLAQTRLWHSAMLNAQETEARLEEIMAQRGPDYRSLQAYVEQTLRAHGMVGRAELQTRPNVVPDSDEIEAIALGLRGVSMQELVNFLHDLHANNPLLALDSLDYLRPARDDRGLDLSMVLLSPRTI